jgi:small-conductance mechanosensitive channel
MLLENLINTKIKKNIKRLQHQNKAKIDRDYESILEEVEKELKEIREEKALMNSL